MFQRLFYSESTLASISILMGGLTQSTELALFGVSILAVFMPITFYYFMEKAEGEQ